MSNSAFYKYFALISLGTAALLIGLAQLDLLYPYLTFAFISLALFMGLTLAMFLIGKITVKSDNKTLFTGTVLGFTFAKMLLSILIVIGYHQIGNPPSKLFIIPFFIVYLIFTIFETYIMMQIGQQSKSVKQADL